MQKKYFLIVFSLLIAINFFAFPLMSALKKNAIQFDMNEDSEIYKTASFISTFNNKLYVVDNFGYRVLVYSLGKLLTFEKQVGRKGQGPGDFNLPVRLYVDDSTIAVRDQLGYSFFSKEGQFKKKFRMFTPTSSFSYNDDRIYCTVYNPANEHLIEVYSNKGEKLAEIGKKYLDLNRAYEKSKKRIGAYEISSYFYRNALVVDEASVYYFDKKFGKVIKFSKDGIVLLKKDLSSSFGEEAAIVIKKNKDIASDPIPHLRGKRITHYWLIKHISLVGDKIYMFCIDNYSYKMILNEERTKYVLRIRTLDKRTMEITKEYQLPIDKKVDGRIYSYSAGEVNGKPIFYIAIRNDEYDHYLLECK